MNCLKCNEKISENIKFCPNCGYKINKEDFFKKYKSQIIVSGISILSITIFISLIILILHITKPKTANCEAKITKDITLSIFKENNEYFKNFRENSVSNIRLEYPLLKSYNKELDKYTCSGIITVESNAEGFLPLATNNPFYNKIVYTKVDKNGDIGLFLKRYHEYKCKVEYKTQLSERKTVVDSTYCGYNDFNNSSWKCLLSCDVPINISNNSYYDKFNKNIKDLNLANRKYKEEQAKEQAIYKANQIRYEEEIKRQQLKYERIQKQRQKNQIDLNNAENFILK